MNQVPIPAATVTKTKQAKPSKKRVASPATPATPVTKKRRGSQSVESLPPNAKSPERVENGNCTCGCAHEDSGDLTDHKRSHFNKTLCSRDNYPKVCSGCKKSLSPPPQNADKSQKEKHCIIGGVFMVRCCHNAVNHHDHKCVFCLCHSCWTERQPARTGDDDRSARGKRSRTTRSLVLPGKRVVGDVVLG